MDRFCLALLAFGFIAFSYWTLAVDAQAFKRDQESFYAGSR